MGNMPINTSNTNKKNLFNYTKTDDLAKMDDLEINQKACCITKQLAYELMKFVADNKGFPTNDPELYKRISEQRLNEYQMRPANELAIKIMRRFKQLKE